MEESKVFLYIWVQGLLRGYAPHNLVWLCKQSRLETGGHSDGLRLYRNSFGLGCVQSRPTTQVGCKPNADVGIGIYRTLWAGVKDRFKWDEEFKIDAFRKSDTYPAAVANKYHPSSRYADTVGAIADRIVWTGLVKACAGLIVGALITKAFLKTW